jgi:hypothetical protein
MAALALGCSLLAAAHAARSMVASSLLPPSRLVLPPDLTLCSASARQSNSPLLIRLVPLLLVRPDRQHSIHADGHTRNADAVGWCCCSCGGWRWRGFCCC